MFHCLQYDNRICNLKFGATFCSAYNRDMFDTISKESDVEIIEIIVGIILLPRFPCCAYTIQVLNHVNLKQSDCIDRFISNH